MLKLLLCSNPLFKSCLSMSRFTLLITLFLIRVTLLAGEFSFSNDPIDVIIPCVEKDLCTLEYCIHGIRENGVNIRRIIVISNKHLTNEAEWFNESDYPFSLHDVADALAHHHEPLTQQLLQSRAGWYYQQLLKLYAHFVIPNLSSNVLVLDSDTIFLRPVTFLNEHFAGMYNPSYEHNIPYFQHAQCLIPGFYKFFPQFSGISHHMVFQKSVIQALFKEIEEHHQAPFWHIFCELVDRKALTGSGASEYEIYFNYVFSHSTNVSIRKLDWRNMRKIRDVLRHQLKKDLDYVCLHSYDRIDL